MGVINKGHIIRWALVVAALNPSSTSDVSAADSSSKALYNSHSISKLVPFRVFLNNPRFLADTG